MTVNHSITELAGEVVSRAAASRLSIVTAESCTAGSLATLLADTPGAGGILQGGFVAYAKACKSAILDVPPELIATETAVSGAVALAMARGALARCRTADLAIAVTCVGGPVPDEDGNPVGLTHVAVCDRAGAVMQEQCTIGGATSGRVRGDAMFEALNLTLLFLKETSQAVTA